MDSAKDGVVPAARFTKRMRAGAAAIVIAALGFSIGHAGAADERSLTLLNLHTKERATIVFKRNGRYDPAGLAKLNQFLRDWRKNEPTKMDPQLFDLIYEVYRQTGATQPINVVCGYRSPGTNAMLRRRSKGVAQNSQHTRGKAMDFFIPGVPLAKLRAVGLKMQAGGVGFYPTSGSPFVHLDTGSVRHWPKMSRQQLLAVFPNGGTIHIPSDGKPLPGYAQALAAYKARKVTGAPVAVAAYEPDEDEEADAPVAATAAAKPAPAAAPVVAEADIPLPRRAPPRPAPVVVAMGDGSAPATPFRAPPVIRPGVDRVLAADPIGNLVSRAPRFAEVDFDATFNTPRSAPRIDFATAHDTGTPVPAALASAMAQRDRSVRSSTASLPIPPTAVVATIDVTRPLRAAAMTSAVLRDSTEADSAIPPVMGFAPPSTASAAAPRVIVPFGAAPVPPANPLRAAAAPAPAAKAAPSVYAYIAKAALTFTALDTQGLRIWIASQSTREKRYAYLTMPDFSRQPDLLVKPRAAFAAGFTHTAYPGLRTDRFAGHVVEAPAVVDLSVYARLAAR